jgi:microcystin-dependent protein
MPKLEQAIPFELIRSDTFGNAVIGRIVNRYDSLAELNSNNPTPEDGEVAYIANTGDILYRHNSLWRSLVPAGLLLDYLGTVAPSGWLLANGGTALIADHPNLYALIGTTFGGDGDTTFGLPDLRRRITMSRATSGGQQTIGETGGDFDHTHAGPSHTHTNPSTSNTGAHTHSIGNHIHDLGNSATDGAANTSLAGNHAHNFSDSFTTGNASTNGISFQSGGTSGQTAQHTHGGSVSGVTSTQNSHSHGTNVHAHDLGDSVAGGSGNSGSAGNHSHTQGATGTSGTNDTGAGNPPYFITQKIVKGG